MKRTIPTLWLLLMFLPAVIAQTLEPCAIEVNGPSTVEPNTPLVFKVKVNGKLPTATPEFKWWLSAGTITKGEGTDEITVDTAGLAGQTLTATVELTGAPAGCKNVASMTTTITAPPICDCRFDSYGNIDFANETARLDNFVLQIFHSNKLRGLMLLYAGKETFKGEAAYRLNRAKEYLTNFRGLDPSRLTTVDCGFAQDLTTMLYVMPEGVTPIPGCSDSYQIPLSEVKFTKPRPKPAKKRPK